MREMDLSGQLWTVDATELVQALGIAPSPEDVEQVDLSAWCVLQKLYCYALWPDGPDSAERRAAMLARSWAKLFALLDADRTGLAATAPPDDPLPGAIHDRILRAVQSCASEAVRIDGGWPAAFAAIPQGEIDEAERNAHLAGKVLATKQAIANYGGNPSMNHAVSVIMETARKREARGLGRTRIRKAWNTHKSGAHLSVAFAAAAQVGRDPDDIEGEVNTILAIARQFQEFALAGDHVPADEIWRVPAALDLPAREPVGFHLDDMMVAALQSYRAPQ